MTNPTEDQPVNDADYAAAQRAWDRDLLALSKLVIKANLDHPYGDELYELLTSLHTRTCDFRTFRLQYSSEEGVEVRKLIEQFAMLPYVGHSAARAALKIAAEGVYNEVSRLVGIKYLELRDAIMHEPQPGY